MNKEFATTKSSCEQVNDLSLDPAIKDLRDELALRLSEAGFYGTISLQVNFRAGKQNWYRISSEYTKGSTNNQK